MSVNQMIEWIGAILAVGYLILAAKRKRSCWYFYIASSALYLFVFWQSELRLNALLQVFFLGMGVRGLCTWDTGPLAPTVKLLRPNGIIGGIAGTGVATVLLSILVGSSMTSLSDSFITAGSLVATFLTERVYLQSWIFWIIIDLFATYFFLTQGLTVTAGLYLTYTALAFKCYQDWKRSV